MGDKKLRVATIFSGIGAPEWALKRLGVPHELVFACDNGEIEYTEDDETIKQHLVTLTSKEAKRKYLDSLLPRKVNFVKKSYLAANSGSSDHTFR